MFHVYPLANIITVGPRHFPVSSLSLFDM